jgi:nucleoside-diphosphate-sugar epimerase
MTRVFVAGAAGVIGRQLVPMLVGAGYEVVGTTRDSARRDWLASVGATPIELDIFDPEAVRAVIASARPDVVVNQMTDLARGFGPDELRANARLRDVGTRHLVGAMLASGVRRLVAQSGAWLYGSGDAPYTEDVPLRDLRADDLVLPGVLALERQTLRTPGIEGIVLRYGYLYGPGTTPLTDADGRPRDPSVHVTDAARAALLAVKVGGTGIFNVVDDGASVSNERARRTLGWAPTSGRRG